MAKKNYRDIARKKVEKKAKKTYKPKTGGRKVQVQSSSGKKGASLGYAIFILICVIGGVAAFVALGDNQEEDEYLAPRIDEENVADSDYTGPTTTPETGIQTGDSVEMDYKLWVGDGSGNVDTEADPYQDSTFTTEVSPNKLIPGFYERVLGLEEGETKQFTVPPEEGYTSDPSHELYGKTLVFWVRIKDIQ